MSERDAFISHISDNPFDLTARLVFADWLTWTLYATADSADLQFATS